MGHGNDVFGEFERRLTHVGLSGDMLRSVMALLQTGLAGEDAADRNDDFAVRVARTFYKTAMRATEALGTTSLSMIVMLFDLFVAYEQKRPISVSSLCIASGAASTTALRQIGQLEARGFVTRQGDAQDRRRSFVVPTARTLRLVSSLVQEWRVVLQP